MNRNSFIDTLARKVRPSNWGLFNRSTANVHRDDDETLIGQIVETYADQLRKNIKYWRDAIKQAADIYHPNRDKLQQLWSELMRDPHLLSQFDIRKMATLAKPYLIRDIESKEEDSELTDLFRKPWFFKLLIQYFFTLLKGTTVLEITDIKDGIPKPLKVANRRHVVPERKMILTNVWSPEGERYDEEEHKPWVLELPEDEELPYGLLNDLAPVLIWKKHAQQCWAEFTQKFGIPPITATTTRDDPKTRKRIQAMLKQMASSFAAVLPEGTKIDVHQNKTADAYLVFDKQIERANSEISKPLTGGTMISDNGSSKSQSEVHERNLDAKIAEADLTNITFFVNDRIFEMLEFHGWNFEGKEFVFDRSVQMSKTAYWSIVQGVLQHYDVNEEWIEETFDIPVEGKKTQPTPVDPTQKKSQ